MSSVILTIRHEFPPIDIMVGDIVEQKAGYSDIPWQYASTLTTREDAKYAYRLIQDAMDTRRRTGNDLRTRIVRTDRFGVAQTIVSE